MHPRKLQARLYARLPTGIVVLLVGLAGGDAVAAQGPTFEPGDGPVVLVDMGHNSLLNGEPFLSPVSRLRDDGYEVRTLTEPFTASTLAGADIVAIVAPLADRNALQRLGIPSECRSPSDTSDQCMAGWNARAAQLWRRPIPSAFQEDEQDTLERWVRQGGSLFLVFDIFPFPVAVEPFLRRFGIEVSGGFAVDERLLPESSDGIGAAGELVFRRADQTLADHPVTNGRRLTERVDSVASIFGSAFRLPAGGQSLFTFGPSGVSMLPEVAWEFSSETPRESIAGWSQGGVMRAGDGRLAIFAESGILQPHRPQFDARYPGMQNSELVLNAFHWLSGLLDGPN